MTVASASMAEQWVGPASATKAPLTRVRQAPQRRPLQAPVMRSRGLASRQQMTRPTCPASKGRSLPPLNQRLLHLHQCWCRCRELELVASRPQHCLRPDQPRLVQEMPTQEPPVRQQPHHVLVRPRVGRGRRRQTAPPLFSLQFLPPQSSSPRSSSPQSSSPQSSSLQFSSLQFSSLQFSSRVQVVARRA